MRTRALAAVILLSAAGAARAHVDAGIDPLKAVVRHGSDTEIWMDTMFGLVFGNAADGGSWQWICEEAVGYVKNAGMYVSPAGTVLVAVTEAPQGLARGVARSTDRCAWEMVPSLLNLTARDVYAAPSGPPVVFVPTGDGFSEGALYRSVDDGETFSKTALFEDARLFTSVRVAPSNPLRVYVASWSFDPAVTVQLHRSDDGAALFTTFELTSALPKAGWFFVRAVHPADPDVVFAEVQALSTNPGPVLLKSVNAGESFTPVLDVGGDGFQVAIDPTTQIVFAGTSTGLYRSTNGGDSFEKLPAPTWAPCAVHSGAGFFTCGSEWADGFTLATSPGGGPELTPVMHLSDIVGPPLCPEGTATRDVCTPIWPAVRASFTPPPDAGVVPDAGTQVDGGPGASTNGGGCGCAGGGEALTAAFIAVAGALLARRHRRRRATGAPTRHA